MKNKNLYWMNYSIEATQNTNSLNLHVGAVAVSKENKLICSVFSNEDSVASWSDDLLLELKKQKVSTVHSLYLTVNTLSSNKEFDLNRIVQEIRVANIYLGVPDPDLTSYLPNDPVLTLNNIKRYPDVLQKKILKQNKKRFLNSMQNIKYNPHYSSKRISGLIIQKLSDAGISISKKEIDSNRQSNLLAMYIANKLGLNYQNIEQLINKILSDAFNEKYSLYNYTDDARSVDDDWKNNFLSAYSKATDKPLESNRVLNVGVGSGNEANMLFSHCKNITFVDIAQDGLKKIEKFFPHANTLTSRAEDLSQLATNDYDLYVSLRTYNSSFFNRGQAISEAYRVLKPNAIIIISIANGFLNAEQRQIITGLLIPGSEFVDIYRGIDIMKSLSEEFEKNGFCNIQVDVTNTEIYMSAISNKI